MTSPYKARWSLSPELCYRWSIQTLRGLHGHTGQVGLEPWLGIGWEVGETTEGNLCMGLNKLEFRNGVATSVDVIRVTGMAFQCSLPSAGLESALFFWICPWELLKQMPFFSHVNCLHIFHYGPHTYNPFAQEV